MDALFLSGPDVVDSNRTRPAHWFNKDMHSTHAPGYGLRAALLSFNNARVPLEESRGAREGTSPLKERCRYRLEAPW